MYHRKSKKTKQFETKVIRTVHFKRLTRMYYFKEVLSGSFLRSS